MSGSSTAGTASTARTARIALTAGTAVTGGSAVTAGTMLRPIMRSLHKQLSRWHNGPEEAKNSGR